jgi:excisionase family DNA binding protein
MTSPSPASITYLSLKDAGCRVRVCERTLRRAIEAGELRAYHVGRLVRIAEPDLAEFVERRPVRRRKK